MRTHRLKLRTWTLHDIPRYHEACNTPAVMRWLGGVQSRFELKRDVRYFIWSELRDGFSFWVVERPSDGAFLGFCGLVRIPDLDCPFRGDLEIGWRIRECEWRKGYGFEAASAVLQYAFDVLKAESVVSRTAAGNLPSQELMRKLCLVRRPDLDYRPAGEVEFLHVFSMSSKGWRGRRHSIRK
jgi:RimJ/RimL family protein N-acetyltransferase